MARCLEKGKQVPHHSLLLRPLCISLSIVFINKAEPKKGSMRISRTRLPLKAEPSSCATMAVSCGAEVFQKVQQSCRDPSMDRILKDPQRHPAQCPRPEWVDCRQRVWHEKRVRRSRDPAWFSHPVRPPKEFWSPTTPDILLLNVPHCPMAVRLADPTEQLVCTAIPNAVGIDLTKDCLCTPLLF